MRAGPHLTSLALAAIAPAFAVASEGPTTGGAAPLAVPDDADPLLAAARRRHPGCEGPVSREDVEAAKGLHVAATHLFVEGRHELALERWAEAYTFDCTAHRLLLNMASAHERLGDARRAWEARALYVERSGGDEEPEIAAWVAAERPVPPHRPHRWRTGLAIDGVVWPTAEEGTAIGIVASGRLRHRALLVELELPFGWWLAGGPIADPQGDRDDAVRASLGNPTASAHYVLAFHDLGWRLGGRLGAPLAAIDDVDWRAASARAAEAEAWRRIGRWAAGRVPLSLASGLDWRVVGPLSLVLDGEATALFPTGEGYPPFVGARVDASFEVRGGLAIEVPLTPELAFGGGAAAQAVWLPTVEGDDAQTAADLWALVRARRFVGRLGTRWAIDGPLGWAFEPGRVATLQLGLGLVLD